VKIVKPKRINVTEVYNLGIEIIPTNKNVITINADIFDT
jgi:hypothetical protein